MPKLNRALVHELATGRYLSERAPVLIVGPCGTDRSHRDARAEGAPKWLLAPGQPTRETNYQRYTDQSADLCISCHGGRQNIQLRNHIQRRTRGLRGRWVRWGSVAFGKKPRRRTIGSGLCQISVEKISTESGLGCTKSTAIPVRYAGRQAAAAGAALLSAVLASSIAEASPATCNMRLTVELTPDVPEPLNSGFLSSLLSNQVNYRLTLLGQQPGSVIVAELAGPGPEYRCRNVIEAMRRDGRVLSIHLDQDTAMRAVGLPRGGLDLRPPDLRTLDIAAAPQIGTSPDSDDAVAVTIAAAPLVLEEKSDAQPPLGGFASLRWAARHPTQAWRVFLPMQLDGDDLG